MLVLGAATASAAEGPRPESARLKRHVEILASPEFGGRAGKAIEKSRVYLLERFKELKFEPLFDGSYTQTVPNPDPDGEPGVNIGVGLVGSDPKLKDEWIVVGAHYDHLGSRGDAHYPGADDNASAVAMMLEIARCVSESSVRPKRSLMFIGFDMEERGLWGSRYFAEHSPTPLSKIKLFITADMIGRSLGGVCPKHVFALGTEHSPWLRPILAKGADPERIKLGILGADVLLIDRSDYGPFRTRKAPFLFISTGENPHYHRITDRAETLDYPKAEAISRMVHDVVVEAVARPEIPGWSAPEHGLDEADTLRDVFRLLLDNREAMKLGTAQVFVLRNAIRSLDGLIAGKTYGAAERSGIIRVSQAILATAF